MINYDVWKLATPEEYQNIKEIGFCNVCQQSIWDSEREEYEEYQGAMIHTLCLDKTKD